MEEDWDSIIPTTTSWDVKKGASGTGRGRPILSYSDSNENVAGQMNLMRINDETDEWNIPLGQSIAGGWKAAIGKEAENTDGGWDQDDGSQSNRDSSKQQGGIKYHKPNQGHMSRECPPAGGGRGNKFHSSQENAHTSRDYPNSKKDFTEGGSKGQNSQRHGHMSQDYTEPRREQTGRNATSGDGGERGAPGSCFRCKKEGHKISECPNPNLGPDGKPRERYVPEEDSDLYGSGISSGTNFTNFERTPLRVTGKDVPNAIRTFEEAGLRNLVMENIKRSGYQFPTPVQKGSIPVVLARRDLIASAITGSGKTAAFLVPVVNILLEKGCQGGSPDPVQHPEVVIIAPTRELAIQIYNEARKFANDSVLKTVIIYGGTVVSHQLSQLGKGCNILVATPGRLKHFVENGALDFSNVQFLILDEADRMLGMGFGPEIQAIAGHPTMTPTGKRQTLMFSATFPTEVQQLAMAYLYDYIFVNTGVIGGTNPDVEQEILEVSKQEKKDKLVEVLRSIGDARTIIFVDTKMTADFIASFLCKKDFQATSIHGDRLQSQREFALRELRRGIRSILVATNVAARGLDIAGVEYVINYDLPIDMEEYVHRIGRTGRVGNIGKSISFYDEKYDSQKAGKLVELLVAVNASVPPFLESACSGIGGYNPSDQSEFRSQDMRRFGKKQPIPTAVEESWD